MKDEVVITTWLWRCPDNWRAGVYGPEHVNALLAMLEEHLTLPFRLVCFTDQWEGIDPKVETLPLPKTGFAREPAGINCYRRLWLFSRQAKSMLKGIERITNMDLDVAITGNIDHLFGYTEDLVINHKADNPRHYNGAFWSHRLGSLPEVWEDFDILVSPQRARTWLKLRGILPCGSDQVWLTHKVKNARVIGPAEGIAHYWHLQEAPLPKAPSLVFFSGHWPQVQAQAVEHIAPELSRRLS